MKNIYRTLAVMSIANLILALLCVVQIGTERVGRALGFLITLLIIQFVIQKIFNLISKMLENNNEIDEAKIFID